MPPPEIPVEGQHRSKSSLSKHWRCHFRCIEVTREGEAVGEFGEIRCPATPVLITVVGLPRRIFHTITGGEEDVEDLNIDIEIQN